jgi:tripartite-type tricarboxylate transporter receptor subunit TctC
MFPGLAAALPHLRSGRMRALAVTGKARSAQLKDVPTMEEVGFKGFDAMQWYGSVGPAGMPADIVRRLNETQVAVLRSPDLASEIARWSALAKARGIRLDE